MEQHTLHSWKQFFVDYGLNSKLQRTYERYVARMLESRLPVIFEFDHLAALLGRTTSYLASVVNCPEAHYRHFSIPKRRGGTRTISAPYPALLECQQWINQHILSRVELHEPCHGFVPGRGIITNATPHLAKQTVLKIDIKDFFHSIPLRRVVASFLELGYPPNVSVYLARLCCQHACLPQGGATSPTLSNIISRRLDRRLLGLAKTRNLTYTRYADDITFSGTQISGHFLMIAERVLNEEGFCVNREKTRFCRSSGKRIVTGLSVASDKLRVPRQYKREVRKKVFYILKYGYFSHVGKLKIRDPFYLDSLLGQLNFILTIEPNNEYCQMAISQLSDMLSAPS